MSHWSPKHIVAVFAGIAAVGSACAYLIACPFCSAINLTFAEQIKSNDIVVIAKLLEIPKPIDDPDLEMPKSLFEITDVIKGNETVRSGMKFRSLLIGKYPLGNNFLVMGVDPPNVAWSTPMKASDRVVEYLTAIQNLPKSGPDRLAFFQNYFEDEESVLAFDAYDEFAQAPYEEVVALKDSMNREQLIKWIEDSDTSTNRRRLYFTMLGVCGKESDVAMLEDFIKSGDRKKQAGLDALIACYLKLKGASGLPLITKTFLQDVNVEYVDTLAAVSALRFHGTEVEFVPKEEIVKSIRTLLDRPKIADMIIPDLARWEDWSVMEKLVQMFKDADEETSWLRVPIASYLRACPKPEAKTYIAELQKIDPESIKRADFFLDFDDEKEEESDGQETDSTETDSTETGEKTETKQESDSGVGKSSLPLEQTHVTRRPSLEYNDFLSDKTHHVSIDSKNVASNNNLPTTVTISGNSGVTNDSVNSELALQTGPEITPVASANGLPVSKWQLLVIPLICSVCILILLWSVISGWFDRLIF